MQKHSLSFRALLHPGEFYSWQHLCAELREQSCDGQKRTQPSLDTAAYGKASLILAWMIQPFSLFFSILHQAVAALAAVAARMFAAK